MKVMLFLHMKKITERNLVTKFANYITFYDLLLFNEAKIQPMFSKTTRILVASVVPLLRVCNVILIHIILLCLIMI